MEIDKSMNQNEVSDMTLPLNQDGYQINDESQDVSIPLNQGGFQGTNETHENGDVSNLNNTLKSPFVPSSSVSGLPSSTPFSKNSKRLFDTKDYFYGDTPDSTPPEIKQAIKNLSPSVLNFIQSRIYHDIRNTFCDKIQDYIESEFTSNFNMFLEDKWNSAR